MASAANQIGEPTVDPGRFAHRAFVIADRGDRAFVVAISFATPPVVGDRFGFQGLTWEITRPKTTQRGLVARPVRHR